MNNSNWGTPWPFVRQHGFWLWATAVSVGMCWGVDAYRLELLAEKDFSAMVRNVALVWGGLVGLGLAAWRSMIANRQAVAAHKQVEAGLRQTEIAQESLMHDRFQRAAEMLGHISESVRIGGIQTLFHLAVQNIDLNYGQVWHLLTVHHMCVNASSTHREAQVVTDALDYLRELRVGTMQPAEIPDLVPDHEEADHGTIASL